jgi:hypothetical protein
MELSKEEVGRKKEEACSRLPEFRSSSFILPNTADRRSGPHAITIDPTRKTVRAIIAIAVE